MTSDKVLILKNVLRVPTIRKKFVSTIRLVKNEFKCVFVSEKVVIIKNETYVGKGYLIEGLFKLDVITIEMKRAEASSYLLESNDL